MNQILDADDDGGVTDDRIGMATRGKKKDGHGG